MSEDANGATEAAEAVTTPASDQVTDAVVAAGTVTDAAKDDAAATAAQDAVADEPFAIAAPEGAEAYQGEFDKFAGDMDGWLKANPDATARQALAEAANRQARRASEGQAEVARQREQQIEAWAGDLKKDTEFGGERYDANVATAIKGLEAVGTPELRTLLNDSGLGSHPDVVRAFWKVGQMVGDTAIVTGQTGTSTRSNFASALYGNGNGKD